MSTMVRVHPTKAGHKGAVKRSLAVLVALLMAAPTAHAGPLAVEEDYSDNTFSFTYDSVEGDLERASSTRILRKRDRVAFLLYVRERAGETVGERLNARLELELLGSRPRRYKGTFSFEITDALGTVVFQGSEEANVLLRPTDNQRVQVVRIPFDLPTGDYSATASFQS